MNLGFSVEKVVKERISVRTYQDKPIEKKKKEKMTEYIQTIDNPFGIDVNFHFFSMDAKNKNQKLGTYGIIKGAKEYVGVSVKDEPLAMEALGYSFERLVLYLRHLGLGTCWLGGTFKKNAFASAMEIDANEIFPIVSPIGYPMPDLRMKEKLMRRFVKSDQRKSWDQLFYKRDFITPVEANTLGKYDQALEMLRMAPSASNKQPWRIVVTSKAFHFYEEKDVHYSARLGYDMQQIDIGIAAAHFHLVTLERNLKGHFEKIEEPNITKRENTYYRFSWICDDEDHLFE